MTCCVLLYAGLRLLYGSVARGTGLPPLILSGLWVSGAAAFASRPLELAGWTWQASWVPLVLFYALSGVVIKTEWKHRRRFACAIAYGTLWPWLDLIALPDWLASANGAIGTAMLVACSVDSISRYKPLEGRKEDATDKRSDDEIRGSNREGGWETSHGLRGDRLAV